MAAQTLERLELGLASRERSRMMRLWRIVRQKPLGATAAVVLILVALLAVAAPLVAPVRYDHQDFTALLQGPSGSHVMGTDDLGRDTFSRVIYGARVSLGVGLASVASGVLLGLTFGLVSGYCGSQADLVLQRFMDALLAMPLLLTAMVIVTVLGPSLRSVTIAIAVTAIPGVNRIVRGSVLSIKETLFVDAARSLGCPPGRIVLRHILPNVLAPVIVIASVLMGFAIITEASLSFLGMGVPPPYPTWGGMLSSSGLANFQEQPWLAIFPGLAISITVLAFNLLGDTLRDLLDPRLRT